MKLGIEWSRPIPLKDASRQNLIYSMDHSKLPLSAGVYIFGRRFGKSFEALYVGKATIVRWRVRGQFKNLPLMLHLKNAKMGKKLLLTGRLISKGGQNKQKCLTLLERGLIRYFLSEGHDLVNKQGTRLRRHEITSVGAGRIVPSPMFVDRTKGE